MHGLTDQLGGRITELEKEMKKQSHTLEELGDRISELDLVAAKESAKVAKDILYLNKELGQIYDKIRYLTDQMHQISTDICALDGKIQQQHNEIGNLWDRGQHLQDQTSTDIFEMNTAIRQTDNRIMITLERLAALID